MFRQQVVSKFKAFLEQYLAFMARNPGVRTSAHSVASSVISSVITYYLTTAIMEDSSSRFIKHLEAQLKESEDLQEKDVAEFEQLKRMYDEKEAELKRVKSSWIACRENVIEMTLRHDAAKRDLKNSFCLYRYETFLENSTTKYTDAQLK